MFNLPIILNKSGDSRNKARTFIIKAFENYF